MEEWKYGSTSALVGGEWSASRPCHFTPVEIALDICWIGGWVNPKAGQEDMEKLIFLILPGLELLPLCLPVQSQSLCRLATVVLLVLISRLYWIFYP
jgi:hypothetical protein